MKTITCPKCSGNGYIAAFAGVAGGVCFKCNGEGRVAYRAPRKYTPKKVVVDPNTMYDIGELLSGVPFTDTKRARAHANEFGISYTRYVQLRVMYKRGMQVAHKDVIKWQADFAASK